MAVGSKLGVGCTVSNLNYQGNVQVEVRLDPNNTVAEVDEANNSRSKLFSIGSGDTQIPTLEIVDTANNTSGANTQFTVNFRTSNAILYFFKDGNQIPGSMNNMVGTMYIAGTHSYTFQDLSVGSHVLGLKACVTDLVSACTGLATVNYTVLAQVNQKSDLIVTDFKVSPADNHYIRVYYKNIGQTQAPKSFDISLKNNTTGRTISTTMQNGSYLPVGEERFEDLRTEDIGENNYTATVDSFGFGSFGLVDELNENNNTFTKTISILSSSYYLQFTDNDGNTKENYAYCDASTDCVSTDNQCYNSGTSAFSDKYFCQDNQWHRCLASYHLGHTINGYVCSEISSGIYGFAKKTAQKPDLKIDSVEIYPVGSNTIRVYFSNIGNASAQDGFRLKLNDLITNLTDFQYSQTGADMNVGEQRYVQFSLQPGNYNFQFTIDDLNTVAESNETNNTLTKLITIHGNRQLISDVKIKNITANSATVGWKSSELDISYILYGTENSPDGINHLAKDMAMVKDHSLLVSNLTPNTTYYFQIQSNSLTSNLVESSVYSFKTLTNSLAYSWSVGDWSTCNNGKQTRIVECKSGAMGVVWDSLCVNAGIKPATEQICAQLQPGDLFTMENRTDAVYYLGTNSKRYVFPYLNSSNIKQDTFGSWNVDQSKIKTISQLTVEGYALGGNVTLRPGTKLIKRASDVTSYAVGFQGKLHKVSIDQRQKLYGIGNGLNWEKNDRVVIMPDAFFVNYVMGSDLNNNYPDGTLIKYNASPGKIYLIYGGYKFPVTEIGFLANSFLSSHVVTAPADIIYPTGQTIDSKYACLIDMAQLATCSFVVPSDEAKLTAQTVNLNSSLTAIAGKTDQLFTNIRLSAEGSSEDIRVTKLSFNHKTSIAGIHQYLSNLKILDNGTVLALSNDPDPLPTTGTDNTATFVLSSPLIIAKGTAKTLTLTANISATAASGTTHQFSIISDVNILAFGQSSNNQVKVAGSYPLNGILINITNNPVNLDNYCNYPFCDSANRTYDFVPLNDPKNYLGDRIASEPYSDWKNYDPLKNKVEELIKDKLTDKDKLIAIADWVKHSKTYGLPSPANEFKSIIEIYNSSTGNCLDSSYLLAAMLRLANVPARSLARATGTLHQLNDAYVNGQWVQVDATFGEGEAWVQNIEAPEFEPFILYSLYQESSEIYNNVWSAIGRINIKESHIFKQMPADSIVAENHGVPFGGVIFPVNSAKTVFNDGNIFSEDEKHGYDPVWMHYNIVSLDESCLNSIGITTYKGMIPFFYSWFVDDNNQRLTDSFRVTGYINAKQPKCKYRLYYYYFQEMGNVAYYDFEIKSAQDIIKINPADIKKVPEADIATFNVLKKTLLELAPASVKQLTPANEPTNEPVPPIAIAARLSGRLLLATEDKGRIHYVYPDDLKKYEVTFGNVMKLFQDLALGISNADLYQIAINPKAESDASDRDHDGYSDKDEATHGYNPDIASDPANRGNDKIKVNGQLSSRLQGKLLLQVEDRGRIWYVDQDGMRWEVTFGNVMNLFTTLALGINNSDLAQIPAGN
ncbi:MAG: CARDB domain-containing protein [bacterium]